MGKGVGNTGRNGSDWLILLLPATMKITLETETYQNMSREGKLLIIIVKRNYLVTSL